MRIKTRDMILAAFFAALTAVGGFINIKVFTVPLTLQLFFCSFAGLLLGSKLGALSQLTYVLIGLLGVPVFVSGGGISYIFNPTFGYLIGFVAAAYIIGIMIENSSVITLPYMVVSIMLGIIVDYLIGIIYFYLICRFYLGKPIGISGSFIMMVPYIIKDTLLGIFAAIASWKVYPVINR